jgi:hypothetical protein
MFAIPGVSRVQEEAITTDATVSQIPRSVKRRYNDGTKFSTRLEVAEKMREKHGGASRDRTDDLIVANDALSQLSYSPTSGNTVTKILSASASSAKSHIRSSAFIFK